MVTTALLATTFGGPIPACLSVMICQALVYREIMSFGMKVTGIESLRPLLMYLFAGSVFVTYGYTLKPFLLKTPTLGNSILTRKILQYLPFISFLIYLAGSLDHHPIVPSTTINF